ncbi:MAG: ribonuclease P protein component [Tannerella sp.]|nr:ribonuclease P protein component [Tannerella sp.]
MTFPKKERLSWKRHTDILFAKGLSFVAYPLRVIYLPVRKEETDAPAVSVLVSVPKKKIRHAVGRNFIKRRIHESYRLRKQDLVRSFSGKENTLLVALLYLSNEKSSYEMIDKAMEKIIHTLTEKMG